MSLNVELSRFYHTPKNLPSRVSPVFVVQMMGRSGPSILQIYARAIDEYRRSAISKLESLCEAQSVQSAVPREENNATIIQ
jgi:hypothetical protein